MRKATLSTGHSAALPGVGKMRFYLDEPDDVCLLRTSVRTHEQQNGLQLW